MSKEMTAEEYLESYAHPDNQFGDQDGLIMNKEKIEHYGDLRAKEAVKEFAEELIKGLYADRHSEFVTIEEIANLAKQKGVEI